MAYRRRRPPSRSERFWPRGQRDANSVPHTVHFLATVSDNPFSTGVSSPAGTTKASRFNARLTFGDAEILTQQIRDPSVKSRQ